MIIYNSMNNIMEDFGAMFGQKRKAVEIQKFNQYELMLKTEKGKLHSRYIAIICISICVWLIASGSAKDDSFISQLSFASTVYVNNFIGYCYNIKHNGRKQNVYDAGTNGGYCTKPGDNGGTDCRH